MRVALILGASVLCCTAACGGGSGDETTATPTSTATAQPTADAGPLPTSTADPSGVHRTPVSPVPAVGIGRDDCPEGWLGYDEEAYSICYPPGYYAHVWSTNIFGPALSIRLIPGEPVAHTPWGVSVWLTDAYDPPTECLFATEITEEPDEAMLAPYESANAAGFACTARLGDAAQFKGSLRAAEGGMEFWVNAADDDQLQLGSDIIETLAPAQTWPPAPTPLTAGPDVRPCTADDLNTAIENNAATGGQLTLSIVLANGSDTACQLAEPPELRFIDAQGHELQFTLSEMPPCAPGRPAFCIFEEPLLLLRAGEARIELAFHIVDDAGPCPHPPPAAASVNVLLPDGRGVLPVGVLDAFSSGSDAVRGIRPCDGTVLVLAYRPGLVASSLR